MRKISSSLKKPGGCRRNVGKIICILSKVLKKKFFSLKNIFFVEQNSENCTDFDFLLIIFVGFATAMALVFGIFS